MNERFECIENEKFFEKTNGKLYDVKCNDETVCFDVSALKVIVNESDLLFYGGSNTEITISNYPVNIKTIKANENCDTFYISVKNGLNLSITESIF